MAGEAKDILKFAALMATAPGLVQKETAKGINRAAYIIERPAMRNTPVITGYLQKGWYTDKATVTGFRAIVGNKVWYAPEVEDRTWYSKRNRRRPPQGPQMLRRAIEATRAEREQTYRDIPANVIRALKAGQR